MPNDDTDIRELIYQALLTRSGDEWSLRPDFTAGLDELVFAPITQELVTALRSAIRRRLDERLGNVIRIEDVQVAAREAEPWRLCVTVDYVVRASGRLDVVCLDLPWT